MTRHKKGNIKSPRRVPQWFLANCVRTADELNNLQARIAISYDTQSKGKTGVSSDSYMVNSSVYQEILDHFQMSRRIPRRRKNEQAAVEEQHPRPNLEHLSSNFLGTTTEGKRS